MGNVITLTFKDPDGVYESTKDYIEESLPEGLDEDEKESLREIRRDKLNAALKKFVEYGEYLTVEIDLDAQTAKVIPNG